MFEELIKSEALLHRSITLLKPRHLLMKHIGHATIENEQEYAVSRFSFIVIVSRTSQDRQDVGITTSRFPVRRCWFWSMFSFPWLDLHFCTVPSCILLISSGSWRRRKMGTITILSPRLTSIFNFLIRVCISLYCCLYRISWRISSALVYTLPIDRKSVV